jgi:nucleolar protein 4
LNYFFNNDLKKVETEKAAQINEDKDSTDNEQSDNEDDTDDDDDDSESDQKVNKNKKKRKLDNKEENEAEVAKRLKLEKKKKEGTFDVKEQRTVFIRNLSFDTNDALVKEAFEKFGQIKSVKLCQDRELERPKGTAFIEFMEPQSAINACAESEIFEMDTRRLQIDMAVSRDKVGELVDEKKSLKDTQKDTRNLALAKIGLIYANSYEGKELSKADLMRRQKLEASNNEKLKILHYFVSPKRLSVHNIPIQTTDEELRQIFYDSISSNNTSFSNVKTHRGGIVECRIMRDLSRLNSDGVGRSKGYGFVEFSSFELAKKALIATNNNPKLFDKGTRLIVQFSIEDMRALKKKQNRIEKSKNKINRKLVDTKANNNNNKNKNKNNNKKNGSSQAKKSPGKNNNIKKKKNTAPPSKGSKNIKNNNKKKQQNKKIKK